jgi:hypothetical protein
MNNEEAEAFYNANYCLRSCASLAPGTKTFIGDRANRVCRFCGLPRPKVTFRKTAHAFPEFIGNRMLFANDECDLCNGKFGDFETHLSRYLGLEVTFSQIPGKRGVPKYKVKEKGPSVSFDRSTRKLLANSHVDDRFIDIDMDQKRLSIHWQRQPYIRRRAFMCLVKMALAIAPPAILPGFSETNRWLQTGKTADQAPRGSICFRLIRSRSVQSLNAIEAVLLTRKDPSARLPYATFFILFYNFTFQIFVPFSAHDDFLVGQEITIPRLPSKMEKFCEVFFLPIEDMSSEEIQRNEFSDLHLAYEGNVQIKQT